MNKLVIAGGIAVGAALLAARYAAGGQGVGGSVLERMPANSPRKWLFSNISAILANTDRILHLLERERGMPGSQPTRAAF